MYSVASRRVVMHFDQFELGIMNETWTELSSNRSLALMMLESGNGQMVEVNGVSMAPPGWELRLSLNNICS